MTRAERIVRVVTLLRQAPAGPTVLGFALGTHPARIALALAVLAAEQARADHQLSPSSSDEVVPGAA